MLLSMSYMFRPFLQNFTYKYLPELFILPQKMRNSTTSAYISLKFLKDISQLNCGVQNRQEALLFS